MTCKKIVNTLKLDTKKISVLDVIDQYSDRYSICGNQLQDWDHSITTISDPEHLGTQY